MQASNKFSRLLKIKYFFKDSPSGGQRTLFTNKSDWNPPQTSIKLDILEHLDHMIDRLQAIPIIKENQNLTHTDRTSLNSLRKNTDVTIKKSDKGSCCVIMNTQDYIQEAEHQLNNKKHYKKLDEPIFKETINQINTILRTILDKKYINQKQFDFLCAKDDSRQRHLYTLPKIHKKPDTEWYVANKIPKGRPIISDCASEGYNVSQYIDHFLQPLASQHDSFLKDTTDFVQHIKNTTVPPHSLLISIDVQSMYTNIDNVTGIQAVRKAFHRNPKLSRPDDQIIQLLEIGLLRNDFTFNNQVYLQCSGTAMGKRWAPSYANLFMAEWEREVLPLCPLKPIFYKRFLDDIFIIWTYNLDQFNDFFQILNNHHPAVKLTSEISDSHLNFLDTTVFKSTNIHQTHKLDIKVFFKTTDTHQLLHKSSFHPKHTFAGIIKSQVLRFNRICTRKEDFEAACKIVFDKLRERGYTKRFLRQIKNNTLLGIEHASITPLQPFQQFGARACLNTKCGTCKYLKPTNSFSNKHNHKTFPITSLLTCESKNIIYLISCQKCHLQYIGETNNTVRDRLNGHLSDIRRNTDKPVARHFNTNDHNIKDLIISPIEKITENITQDPEQTKKIRLIREDFWIEKLNTLTPNGINTHKTHNILPLVIKFNKTSSRATQIFRETYIQLQNSFPKIYTDNIIIAYAKNKSLSQLIAPSKLQKQKNT